MIPKNNKIIRNPNNPDQHAKRRDVKSRKKHRLTDNRKSVQLIAKLSSKKK